jgi:hypothetical protein
VTNLRRKALLIALCAIVLSAAGASGQTPQAPGAAPSAKTERVDVAGQNRSLPAGINPASAASRRSANAQAYVCDDQEVSVIDVTNPVNPQIVATALSSLIKNSANIHCAVQRGNLVVFADQTSTLVANGGGPGVSSFSLANPVQPQLINATSLTKRFFQDPVYIGNFAFVPTAALTFFLGFQWDGEFGDLISVDLTNFNSPALVGTLAQPQVNSTFGGATPVLGAVQADTSLIYLGGSTATGGGNSGIGRLQVADVTSPTGMKLTGQLLIPGTIHSYAPLIQGTVAVGIGNTGGYVGSLNVSPGEKGNIVVTTFDVSDRRSPAILSTTTTTYTVGVGGGATRIGNYLFAFAGVLDANNNQVLLIVDISNPLAPVLQSFPISQPFTSMQAVGTTLYATLGAGGFATYSIPGIGGGPVSVCPAAVDAMLVVDRGAQISSQAFLDAKTALKAFVDSLHLTPDQAGVVSFTNSAHLDQTLTTNGAQTKTAVDAIIVGGSSYIGAGIAAAQLELTGPRHNATAAPLMIVLSDGADSGAPNNTATIAAANAAKAAGIRIITLQYGVSATALMKSIASSNTDFYLVGQ